MKAYWMSVLALVVISALAGGILTAINPSAADGNRSVTGATRL